MDDDLATLPPGALLRRLRLGAAPRLDETARRSAPTRDRSGLTQQELEGRSGLTVRAIREIESGRHVPLPDTVERLATALDLTPALRALFVRAAGHERDRRRGHPYAEGDSGVSSFAHPMPTGSLAVAARGEPFPALLTSFVGRSDERRRIVDFLLSERPRLITLTGAPGTGKTRLALEVATAVRERFADGAHFVPLAPLREPTLIPMAVARALGLGEPGAQLAPATLADYLRGKDLLLVLDNVEHLAVATAAHDLLAAAPGLKILATSRTPLRLYGEQVIPVPPLDAPPRRPAPALPPGELAKRYPAVALFVDRARLGRPDFALTPENSAAVGRICAALDGLPLAIELAAARCAALSPHAILAQLQTDARHALLTQDQLNVLAPHRTLDDAIAWSQRLLSDSQQALFRRLAVFAGGCTFAAAAAVCAEPGDAGAGVPEQVSALADVALVQIVPAADDDRRIGMLETIRAYAAQELERSGEGDLLRQRHACYYLDLAGRAEGRLLGAEQPLWLRRLEREYDNLRAALRWLLEGGDVERALWLAGTLWLFWFIHGHAAEGCAWLEEALSRADALDAAGASSRVAPSARARALFAAGFLALYRADTETARARYAEALRVYRQLGNRRGEAWALLGLAQVAYRRADDRAWDLHHEALSLFRDVGDAAGIGWALGNLGLLARPRGESAEVSRRYLEESVEAWRGAGDWWGRSAGLGYLANDAYVRGDLAAADQLYTESVRLLRDLGFRAATAWRLNSQGDVVRLAGDDARAGALYQESYALFAELGIDEGRAWTLHNLGHVALGRGDIRRATPLFADSLAAFRARDDRCGLLSCLAGLAGALARSGQGARAARLLGAVSALRAAHNVRFEPVDETAYRRIASGVRAHLGGAAWAASAAQGRVLTLERAVEEGRAAADRIAASAHR